MKSIFKLNKKEWKKLEKELRKSYFYRQYIIEFIVGIIFFSFVCGFFLGRISGLEYLNKSTKDMYISIGVIIFFGFITILAILFAFKKLDLLKKYYEENKEK